METLIYYLIEDDLVKMDYSKTYRLCTHSFWIAFHKKAGEDKHVAD
jgi:hypothetical protein